MTDFSSITFPAPKDWQAFERATRLLFQYVLQDPNTQNNGRPGQRQHGVDVYGYRGGGNGPLVGIQCKGKDNDYGNAVTTAELEAEVRKSDKFKPPLREFILVTTAPDDAPLQEAARLLQEKLQGEGRTLSIAVWGWGRVQQEIGLHPQAIAAFHPDWTPFSGPIMDGISELLKHLRPPKSGADGAPDEQAQSAIVASGGPQIATDPHVAEGVLDRHLHDQIDTYRDLIRGDRPRTALELLTRLKEQVFAGASPKIKFRIVANIGAAQHRLGRYDEAADNFLEAASYSPDEIPAIANKIAALLIKQRRREAHEFAVNAVATHPENPDIALQRLQARGDNETVEGLWASLPDKLKNDPNLITFRLVALREDQRPEWQQLAIEAAATHPHDKRLQIFKAETILDRVLAADRSMLGAPAAKSPTQAELLSAAETLEAAWDESRSHESPAETSLAHNGALLWKLLRQPEKAARMLDAAFGLGLEADEAIRLRLTFFRRPEETAEAIKFSERLHDTPQARTLRAELQIADNPARAREILAGRAIFTGRDIVPAAQVFAESLVKEGKFDEAIAEAERVIAAVPDDPNGSLIKYRIKLARADVDAESDLDAALAKVQDDTDFPTRYLVTEALEKAKRFDDVVELLNGRVSTAFDSMALRSLVAAAANADRRSTLSNLLESVSPDVRRHSFYRSARIALAIKTGDIRGAEREIRSYLAERPRNLEMHLQLLHALFRQDKIEALKGETVKPASDFDGIPADFMKLAQFKEGFGDVREAYALAYATLMKNQNDAETSMGYVGVFLRPGHSKELDVSPAAAATNMAVDLRDPDGKSHVYVIEPEPDLRISPLHIAPTHRIAQALMGQGPNASVAMPDGTAMRIAGIKPKELHALHEVMENFQNVFPDEQGMERVRIDTASPQGLEPIAERLRERHDAIETVSKLYDSGALPLSLAARSLGSDTIDTLIGFGSSGRTIRVSQGTHFERETAFAAIQANNAKGCVVDAVTLHIIRRLDLLEAVRSQCGPLGIVDRTARRWQRKIFELKQRIDEPDLSLSWSDGKIYRTETTVEQKREALSSLEADAAWIAANTTTLPADGTRDPGAQLRQLMHRFGSGFVDELRAAQGAGHLLLSEDLMLRSIGQSDFAVPSTWLQPVLMRAADAGALSPDAYRKAIVAMIEAKFSFISIDAKLLKDSIAGLRQIALPEEFIKLASRLGGKDADMRSHLNVVFNAIRLTWNDKAIPETARRAILGTFLTNLLKERPINQMRTLIRACVQFGDMGLGDADFADYIARWLQGHFIDLSEAAA